MVTEATDAHYDNHLQEWALIDKMLTGNSVRTVLTRGAYEAKRAFEKRRQNADWKPYTRDLVSRLTGELFSRWDERSSTTIPASEDFLSEVGPEGESYRVQLINLAETLTAWKEAWAIMDPAEGLHIVPPHHVTRSTDQAVVLKGTRSKGGTVFTDEKTEDSWTVYYADRYEVYAKEESDLTDDEEVKRDEGFYRQEGWSFNGPPAVRIELPWRVNFGLAVARAHRAIYRLESKYDAALTNSLGGLIQIATGGDEELRNRIQGALKKGAIAIEYSDEYGEHKPLNVGTEGLGPGAEALKRKRKELYRSAYQSLDQASQRMTATEADARTRSGPVAALSVLAATMESAEEEILPMLARAEQPFNETLNPSAEVDWPTDFSHAYDSAEDEIIRLIFGSVGMPVDKQTATDVVVSRLESAGLAPDRDAVAGAVEDARSRAEQDPTGDRFVS